VSVRSTTITTEGRATRRNIELLVAAIIGVAIVGWALAEFGRQQTGTGPSGSSFVTDVNGTAAMAELLVRLDHTVIPVTAPFEALEEGGTVFIISPSIRAEYAESEIASLESWVRSGGRLIVAGRPHPDLVGTMLPNDLRQGFNGREQAEIVTSLGGVDGFLTSGGVLTARTDADHLVLAGSPPVAIAFGLGEGEVVYVADHEIFSNALIDDNAAWVVSLVPAGNVRFDEVRHGFTAAPASEDPTRLLTALPPRVRSTVLLLLPVLGVALVVYGRRFGPPEETERDLAPPRRELVDAMAGLLARLPDATTAAEPVVERLRSEMTRLAGLPHDTADADVVAVAERLGLDQDAVSAALEMSDEDGLFTAQRLLATLSEREQT
jgi:hypothetical protein